MCMVSVSLMESDERMVDWIVAWYCCQNRVPPPNFVRLYLRNSATMIIQANISLIQPG